MQKKFSKRIVSMKSSPILDLNSEVSRLKKSGVSVIDLSLGEPDFDTPKHIGDAAKAAIDSGQTHYTPTGGIWPLREGIARKLRKDNGLEYEPSQVVVGVGTKQILASVFEVLCDTGDEVIIPTPAWATYVEQVRLAGAIPVMCRVAEPFKLNAALLEKVVSPKTKVLLLNSPANPTGAVIEKQELLNIARLAVQKNIFVVSDEIYEKIHYRGRHVSIASLGQDIKNLTVTVNGFSKAYAMTGWRVGYAAGPKKIMDYVAALSGQTTSGTSSVSQWAALSAVSGSQVCVRKMAEEFRRRGEFLFRAFLAMKGFSLTSPDGAFYLFPNIGKFLGKKYKTSDDWAHALLVTEGVAVVSGEAFFAPEHIRVSFAAPMSDLREAVKRIKRFVESER